VQNRESGEVLPMGEIVKLNWWVVIGLFRSRASVEAETLMLRHRLNVLRRKHRSGSPSALSIALFLPVFIELRRRLQKPW
jgi:hypothetical protein